MLGGQPVLWAAYQTFHPWLVRDTLGPARDRRTAMASDERAVLDPQDLDRMLRDGEVDTVLCALPETSRGVRRR